VHLKTFVPYSLAFALSAIFVLRASRAPTDSEGVPRTFRRMLRALACLLLLVLASTWFYKLNGGLHAVHVSVAVVTVCFESAMSVWLVVAILRDRSDWLVLCCQLAGFALAAGTFAGWIHVLFVAQLIASAAFGVLLVRAGQRLDAEVGT
jgi:hypothetical protein